MFHVHCGPPGVLGPVVMNVATLAGDDEPAAHASLVGIRFGREVDGEAKVCSLPRPLKDKRRIFGGRPQLLAEPRVGDFMKKLLIGISLVFAFVASGIAYGHSTGNERRTVRQCRKLGTKGQRKACRACVSRKRPHHYHPKAAAGARCRPNTGKR